MLHCSFGLVKLNATISTHYNYRNVRFIDNYCLKLSLIFLKPAQLYLKPYFISAYKPRQVRFVIGKITLNFVNQLIVLFLIVLKKDSSSNGNKPQKWGLVSILS